MKDEIEYSLEILKLIKERVDKLEVVAKDQLGRRSSVAKSVLVAYDNVQGILGAFKETLTEDLLKEYRK